MAPSSNQPTDTASPAAEHCPSSTVGPAATVIDIPISETTSRSRVPHTSHFRFPNTLPNLGSGTGKPLKFRDQKPIRKRDPAHELRIGRDDAERLLPCQDFLAVFVPTLIELAFVF